MPSPITPRLSKDLPFTFINCLSILSKSARLEIIASDIFEMFITYDRTVMSILFITTLSYSIISKTLFNISTLDIFFGVLSLDGK